MARYRIVFLFWAFWLSLTRGYATPIAGEELQVIGPYNSHDAFVKDDALSERVNITFDEVDTGGDAKRNLTALSELNYKRFDLINITAAIDAGVLSANDSDCATSKPNAIISVQRNGVAGPSHIIANSTALAAGNQSQLFDLVAWSIEPVGRTEYPYSYATVSAWEIRGNEPRFVHRLFAAWGTQRGHLHPIVIQPAKFFPGWGEMVNWIEFEVMTWNGQKYESSPFCVDDLVLDVYKENEKRDRGRDYGFHGGAGPVVTWNAW